MLDRLGYSNCKASLVREERPWEAAAKYAVALLMLASFLSVEAADDPPALMQFALNGRPNGPSPLVDVAGFVQDVGKFREVTEKPVSRSGRTLLYVNLGDVGFLVCQLPNNQTVHMLAEDSLLAEGSVASSNRYRTAVLLFSCP